MTVTRMERPASEQLMPRRDRSAPSVRETAIHHYRLIYGADRTGPHHIAEFEASDAQQALHFGRLQPAGRRA